MDEKKKMAKKTILKEMIFRSFKNKSFFQKKNTFYKLAKSFREKGKASAYIRHFNDIKRHISKKKV